jgi:E3 SUMO-protein ligase NSE2
MYTLDAEAKRMLATLSDNRRNRKLKQHVEGSMKYMQESVASINDRLTTRRQQAESSASKRQKVDDSQNAKTDEDLQQRSLAELDAKVTQLTKDHEAAFRELIDYRNGMEDEQDVIKIMREQVDAQEPKVRPQRPTRQNQHNQAKPQRRRNGAEDEEDEDEEQEPQEANELQGDLTPYIGASEILKKVRETKAREYTGTSARERYARDNDYIEFRKLLHHARNSDEVPLPHASKWFDQDDNPVLLDQDNAGTGDDDDDDLVIEREIIDIRCPLSRSVMKNPMMSNICKHTFEKGSIMEFIEAAGRGGAKCPVCTKVCDPLR